MLALRLLEKDRGIGFGEGAEVPDAVLITGSLMLGVYTIVESAADYGWGVGPTLGLGTISLVLLGAFVVREANCVRVTVLKPELQAKAEIQARVEPADREAA